MLKIIIVIFFVLQFFISCGFTPTLKMSEKNQLNPNVYFEMEGNSYLARQTLNEIIKKINKSEAKFLAKVRVNESESAVNIQSNGSVDEYKVEVLINFQIINIENNNLIYESQSRGFANYDVSNSEYTNTLVKNNALETAISDAAQLMNIMVQSKIAE